MRRGLTIGRLTRAALALLGLLAVAAAPAPPPRIVAVGDLHGDFSAWQDIARNAGLIDARGHWAGGKTILVQLGDITDRGPDSLKIVHSLQQLQKEAPKTGGKTIVLLGNHEAMNLLGDDRYVTAGEYAAFANGQSAARRDKIYEVNRAALEAAARGNNPTVTSAQVKANWLAEHPLGWVEHRLAWSPSGDLGKWATKNPAVLNIGGTLFAHGGISVEYSKVALDEINRRAAAAMAAGDQSLTGILSDPLGPLWYRGLVTTDADAQEVRAKAQPPAAHFAPEQELGAVLAAYNAKRLVIAHTPDLRGIQISPDRRLIRIDTGISRFYGGPLTWLEINGESVTAHTVPRSSP